MTGKDILVKAAIAWSLINLMVLVGVLLWALVDSVACQVMTFRGKRLAELEKRCSRGF